MNKRKRWRRAIGHHHRREPSLEGPIDWKERWLGWGQPSRRIMRREAGVGAQMDSKASEGNPFWLPILPNPRRRMETTTRRPTGAVEYA